MMRSRGAKGHILVHVLITAVIIAVISAGIARMLLVRYALQNRATVGAQNQRYDTSGVDRVLSIWAKYGTVCSDHSTYAGYTCSPVSTTPPGTANCTCCPTDNTNDAGMKFVGGALRVETPSSPGVYPDFSCP